MVINFLLLFLTAMFAGPLVFFAPVFREKYFKLGYMALTSAIDDPRRSDRAGALVAIVGAVNVPIIYFSVKWWNTLHQGASVSVTQSPSMAQTMLWGMLIMALAYWMMAIALVLYRVRSLILWRERHAD